MNGTADELAGIVDLFGGLTRTELARALEETAFRDDGRTVDEGAVDDALEEALESFALVRYEPTADGLDVDDPLYVAGPTAFPRTPDHAEDLPHILGIDRRRIDRESLARAARRRFEAELESALEAESIDRLEELLEVSYDLETWGPIDLTDERAAVDGRLE